MSFRNRLYLFFAVLAIAPVAAVVIVLLGASAAGRADESDARLAQGLRTAFALYEDARGEARAALPAIARDRALTRAVRSGDRGAASERARALLAERPDVAAVAVYDRGGRRLVREGTDTAVAGAGAAPADAEGDRLGTLVVSTTPAPELVARIRRLTGLDARVLREGSLLGSSIAGAATEPPESGDTEIGGRDVRARYARIGEPAGRPVTLGMIDPAGASGFLAGNPFAVAAILIVLLLLVIAAAVMLARGLQEQLGQLLDAARRLRQGDFTRRVAVTGDDRFAALGAEFNAMSDELAAKIDEVEAKRRELDDALRRVGDAFAAGLDREGIVDLALRTALEACAADVGHAVPIDREKMTEATVGPVDDELREVLREAERAAFRVAPDDGPEDGRRAYELPRASHAERDGAYALAAPLRGRLGARNDFRDVGVLSIARRGGDFLETQRDLFTYLAGQAAVSLENAHLHERVQLEAVTDELTGLDNPRQFRETIRLEVERARRFGAEVGLVLLDLDDFKRVNDTYGHQQGDLVLIEVARVMRELSRDIDHPFRYGGEELGLILPQTGVDGAEELAERIRAAIERLRIVRLDGAQPLRVTASFGVAAMPASAGDEQSLVAAADAALYRAKRAGKNRVARAEAATAAG